MQGGMGKKYAAMIKKARNNTVIYKQFKSIDDGFESAEKALMSSMKAMAALK